MGALIYGEAGNVINFDDRALTHLQIVMIAKLRRKESFLFSWIDTASLGSGRSAIWINPASTLYFRYFGSRCPTLNREWIETLMLSANSVGGLVYTSEPTPEAPGGVGGHVIAVPAERVLPKIVPTATAVR